MLHQSFPLEVKKILFQPGFLLAAIPNGLLNLPEVRRRLFRLASTRDPCSFLDDLVDEGVVMVL